MLVRMRKAAIPSFALLFIFAALVEGVSIRIVTDGDSSGTAPAVDSVTVGIDRGGKGEAVFKSDGAQWLSLTGEPRVPWRVLEVLLPPDAELSSVGGSLRTAYEPLPGTWVVPPMPPMATRLDGEELVIWPSDRRISDGRDADVYERDAFWPEDRFRLLGTGELREWRLAEVSVPLARYNPVRSALEILREAEVSVSFDRIAGTGSGNDADPPYESGRSRVRETAINFDQVSGSYETAGRQRKSLAVAEGEGYAIITTSSVVNGSSRLDDFVAYKESIGFNVQVVTEAQFGGGQGDTAADNIRTWLRSHYLADNIEYVLLIGNPDPVDGHVPMKITLDDQATDFYYADLSGDWDRDGDGIYGEYLEDGGAGGLDRYWEVLVGRIPYYGDIGDTDAILQESIHYDLADPSWRKSALLPMVPFDANTPGYHLGEQIRSNLLLPRGWSSHRLYERLQPQSPSRDVPLQ